MKTLDKIKKVNNKLVSYRGFYFEVNRTTYFNGGTKSIEYYGLSDGMKFTAFSRADLKGRVDRRIHHMIKLMNAHHNWKGGDSNALEIYANMEVA